MSTATAERPRESVKSLLSKLAKAKDEGEKHGLRVKLRKLGHKGGLRTSKRQSSK